MSSAVPSTSQRVTLFAQMRERPDLSAEAAMPRGVERRQAVFDKVNATAARSQAPVIAAVEQLAARGVVTAHESFPLGNALAVTTTQPNVDAVSGALRALPGVKSVIPDGQPVVSRPSEGPRHSAMATYRGHDPNGRVAADYNWFDAAGGSATPIDHVGQGTHVAATVLGAGRSSIGVAPDAKLLAATGLNGGTTSGVLKALQWVSAPTKADGTAPDPAAAPDILQLGKPVGGTYPRSINQALRALSAAGTIPVLSGSSPSSNDATTAWRHGETGRGTTVGVLTG